HDDAWGMVVAEAAEILYREGQVLRRVEREDPIDGTGLEADLDRLGIDAGVPLARLGRVGALLEGAAHPDDLPRAVRQIRPVLHGCGEIRQRPEGENRHLP